jgi:hypothetical protein
MLRRSLLLAIAAGMIPAAVCCAAAASAAPVSLATRSPVRATTVQPTATAVQPAATRVSGYLSAVAAISGSKAWAVGDVTSGSTYYPLTMRWTGKGWAKVASPRLSGGRLTAVAMSSASSAWAVGSIASATTAGASESLILHWNGSAWTRVPSPNPSSSVSLSGVATAPGGKAWAVGTYNTSDTKARTLILRWNGTVWTKVASPSPGSEPGLTAVTVLSARSAWAVGSAWCKSCDAFKTVILRWNGLSWTRVRSPSPGYGGTYLNGVAATSARSAWAVGSIYGCGCGSDGPTILHWNGKVWKSVHAPNPLGGAGLSAVAAISARSAFAVGGYPQKAHYPDLDSLILHWNGKTWKQVASPSQAKRFNNLGGIAVVSARFGLAVGGTLSLRWNGKAWK